MLCEFHGVNGTPLILYKDEVPVLISISYINGAYMCERMLVIIVMGFLAGCGSSSSFECEADSDCGSEQECVINHDHEGDDHVHGGTCEDIEAEG